MKTTIICLFASALFLTVLGVVSILGCTYHIAETRLFQNQICAMLAGLGMAYCVSKTSYRRLLHGHLPIWFFILAILLLSLVLIPGIGNLKNGGRRWFVWGGQPSEMAKLALVLFLAYYGSKNHEWMSDRQVGFVYPGLFVLIAVLLVFLEPDWGTALLLLTTAGGILFLAGTEPFYLISTAIIGFELLVIGICRNPVRLNRILAFNNLELYARSYGHQQYQSQIAIGSGGWFGMGLGQGHQQFGFVPEQYTDFILSAIGEEWGFIGTTGITIAFMVILLAGIWIFWHAPDGFGQLLAGGITILIGVQALINIGVVTAALPNKGIPLPFITYGCSDLLTMWTAIGLLINIARHCNTPVVLNPAPTCAPN